VKVSGGKIKGRPIENYDYCLHLLYHFGLKLQHLKAQEMNLREKNRRI